MADIDIAHLKSWVGREEIAVDSIKASQIAALAATLDWDDPPAAGEGPLPPLWHYMAFPSVHRQSAIGPDGHAQRGGFLPPVPLPRRMWAGSDVRFHAPIRAGMALRRVSRILDVELKSGNTGALVFVRVGHEITGDARPVLSEVHNIVYRAAPAPGDPPQKVRQAPADAAFEREIVPEIVMLFRYSALTFNGHRIHYDRPYVTTEEGYPGLVVHGPLIATLLVDLVRSHLPGRSVQRFEYRSHRALFDTEPFLVCGRLLPDGNSASLWARTRDGQLAQEGTVTLG